MYFENLIFYFVFAVNLLSFIHEWYKYLAFLTASHSDDNAGLSKSPEIELYLY